MQSVGRRGVSSPVALLLLRGLAPRSSSCDGRGRGPWPHPCRHRGAGPAGGFQPPCRPDADHRRRRDGDAPPAKMAAGALTGGDAVEPPVGIEPTTYALRGPPERIDGPGVWPVTRGNASRRLTPATGLLTANADWMRTGSCLTVA